MQLSKAFRLSPAPAKADSRSHSYKSRSRFLIWLLGVSLAVGVSLTARVCWCCCIAHPASNNAATISDRNFTHYILAPLTPSVTWRYRCASHETQRHHRLVPALVNACRQPGRSYAVADGVLVGLTLWGRSIIGLAVECPDGKYFSSIRAQCDIYDRVLVLLRQSHGRKLREVMDAEIDITDVIQ